MVTKTDKSEISILEISQGVVRFGVVGTSPLVFNRVTDKTKRILLLGGTGRKTSADRAQSLKHNPPEEYRDSAYQHLSDAGPTRLYMPAPAFHQALTNTAKDMPGVYSTEIGRLTWVEGRTVDIYGTPKLFMAVVRSADMKKTPDIRTRAIVEKWACMVTVRFVQPKMRAESLANLFAASGLICGVGDGRQEKGSGLGFGQYRLAEATDPELIEIMRTGGIEEQDAALRDPVFYDADSEELYSWFLNESPKRQGSTKRKPVTGEVVTEVGQ